MTERNKEREHKKKQMLREFRERDEDIVPGKIIEIEMLEKEEEADKIK